LAEFLDEADSEFLEQGQESGGMVGPRWDLQTLDWQTRHPVSLGLDGQAQLGGAGEVADRGAVASQQFIEQQPLPPSEFGVKYVLAVLCLQVLEKMDHENMQVLENLFE
jgi:hypothetical protein